jgi:DNA-binding transcriptional LysR family regulator
MNIQDLRYLVQIDRVKSISKTAELLYVSQPTLSRAVRELENETGIIIFYRTNKGVTTTHDGKEFIEQIKTLLRNIDQLESQYFHPSASFSDEVTLLVGAQRSSPAVAAFSRFYKKNCTGKNHLNLALQEGNRDYILNSVFNHTFNLGIVHYMSSEEDSFMQTCKDMGLSCHLLDDSLVYVQIRRGHPLAGKRTISLDMLKPYPHITFADEDLTGINYCSDIFQYNRHILDKRIIVQDRGTLRHLTLETNGYYFGNYAKCKMSTQQETVYIPLEGYPYTIKTVYIYQNERKLTQEERMYIQFLEETYREKSADSPSPAVKRRRICNEI